MYLTVGNGTEVESVYRTEASLSRLLPCGISVFYDFNKLKPGSVFAAGLSHPSCFLCLVAADGDLAAAHHFNNAHFF